MRSVHNSCHACVFTYRDRPRALTEPAAGLASSTRVAAAASTAPMAKRAMRAAWLSPWVCRPSNQGRVPADAPSARRNLSLGRCRCAGGSVFVEKTHKLATGEKAGIEKPTRRFAASQLRLGLEVLQGSRAKCLRTELSISLDARDRGSYRQRAGRAPDSWSGWSRRGRRRRWSPAAVACARRSCLTARARRYNGTLKEVEANERSSFRRQGDEGRGRKGQGGRRSGFSGLRLCGRNTHKPSPCFVHSPSHSPIHLEK